MGKSTIARGASMAADVWGKLDDRVKAKGGTEDAMHILAKDEGATLLDTIADLLVKAEQTTRTRFTVKKDYSKSVEDMVKAGRYDSSDSDITAEHFPVNGTGTVEEEVVLIHFGRLIEGDDAEREMDAIGLEPSPIEETLAVGAQYPDVQRQFPVVGLGSSWAHPRGGVCVPVLGRWGDERELHLGRRAGGWDAFYRFLARRKRK